MQSMLLEFFRDVYRFASEVVSGSLGELVAALAGAFAGALAAFRLQIWRESELKEEKEYAAIIAGQHALFFMWRILFSMRKQHLDPKRTEERRQQTLGLFWMIGNYVPVNIDSLVFLFRPGHRTLLTNLFAAERGYLSAVDAVGTRNAIVQEIISSAGARGITDLALVPEDRLRDPQLKSATDALYTAVDRALTACEKAFAELRAAAKEAYPKKNFLQQENLTAELFGKSE